MEHDDFENPCRITIFKGQGDKENKMLPETIQLTWQDSKYEIPDSLIESINEYLANEYGFTNKGFDIQIILRNVDWDKGEE